MKNETAQHDLSHALAQRHAPIVALAVSLHGPVSPRVFSQRSM